MHGAKTANFPCDKLIRRSLAVGLPETIEQASSRPALLPTRRARFFATLWDEDYMNVMLDEARILTAADSEPETCTEFRWGKRLGAVQVTLARDARARLSDLLVDAWSGRRRRGWWPALLRRAESRSAGCSASHPAWDEQPV